MEIGIVGLGKMGANMTQRLIEKGHDVVAFDLSAEARVGPRCRCTARFEPGRPRREP